MLNNIKNLFLLENSIKLSNYNCLNSNIRNIKNNFKLKLLKKKFIQVFLNINKINKSIKIRSFLLKSNILETILEKIKYLEIIIYSLKDSHYFYNSNENSTLIKLLFLRLIHLNYIKNSFNISNILNNFKLKRVFHNLEYRRRLIRKYYLSQWVLKNKKLTKNDNNQLYIKLIENFKKIKSFLNIDYYKNFENIILQKRLTFTIEYKNILNLKYRFIKRFRNNNDKLSAMSTKF
jgi:hypothetical protein